MAKVIHFRGNKDHPHGSPTLREYALDDEHDINLIEGPVESGKTTGTIAALYRLMCSMPRSRDGIRRSRILVVRPTYGELLETVVEDWLEWFPEKLYGPFKRSEPYKHTMKFLDVECEVVFMALMRADNETLRKLRSSFFTAAWVNEGQYCPLRLFTEIIDRTGRYPRKVDCPDYDRRKRAYLDNNAPPVHTHWIRLMRGDIPIPANMPDDQKMAYRKPDNWCFRKQPPAVLEVRDPVTGEHGVLNQETGVIELYKLNPDAENLQWMGENPYLPALAGKPKDQIDRDFRNISRPTRSGTPRYPMFDRDRHVAKHPLKARDDQVLYLGMDFGLTPAVMFEQKIDGRWYTLWEHVADNEGAKELALSIKKILAERFAFVREVGVSPYGDPAGGWRGVESSKKTNTTFAILRAEGIPVVAPQKKDNPELRMNIGRQLLLEEHNGGPRVLIDPRCVRLIEALDGGAQMVTTVTPGGVTVKEQLVKNEHSHPIEAWEYTKWGAGEGKDMIMRPESMRRSGRVTNTTANPRPIGTPGRSWAKVAR